MRLGLIARPDSAGLGTMSWEYARHLKPAKCLLVYLREQNFPERFSEFPCRKVVGSDWSDADIAWFLDGIDVLLSIETFYCHRIVEAAKRKGIKTVLITMYEMQTVNLMAIPDLFLCPSPLDLTIYQQRWPNIPAKYLPVPVATDRLIHTLHKTAKTFIHTASHGGIGGRKGTGVLLEAMKLVKSDIKLRIFTWGGFKTDDPRISVEQRNFKNYWQAWREGDVLVYPQGANGICLPIIEAMASGLGVITTDFYPFNEYMPKSLLVKPASWRKHRFGNNLLEVDDPVLSPIDIAAKIDEVSNMSIESVSRYGRAWAQKNSWEKLLPLYTQILEDLCR